MDAGQRMVQPMVMDNVPFILRAVDLLSELDMDQSVVWACATFQTVAARGTHIFHPAQGAGRALRALRALRARTLTLGESSNPRNTRAPRSSWSSHMSVIAKAAYGLLLGSDAVSWLSARIVALFPLEQSWQHQALGAASAIIRLLSGPRET